jgi:hypothetical protein
MELMRNLEELTGRIAKLNPAQLEVVEKLVQKLESGASHSALTLDQAVDEFEREHPELLRLLAQ